MIELLPCPFCGGQAELISTDIFEPSFAMSVRCTDCHTGTMYYTYNDTDGLQDAIDVMCDLWNTRAELGSGTCGIVKTLSDSDYVDDWRYRCSECGGNIPVNERDPDTGDVISAANYCPNCGAKVVGE